MTFTITPNVNVGRDADGHIRSLEHLMEPYVGSGTARTSIGLAEEYLRDVAQYYEIAGPFLIHLDIPVGAQLTEEGTEVRFAGMKSLLGTDTVSFAQTHFGLPIWEAGVSIVVQTNPLRVTSSHSTFHIGARFHVPGPPGPCTPGLITGPSFASLLEPSFKGNIDLRQDLAELEVNSTRLLICQYDKLARLHPKPPPDKPATIPSDDPIHQSPPSLPLPPVPASIRNRTHYVVSEVLFSLALPDWGLLNWRAFTDIETCSVIYLRSFVASLHGKVFAIDPVSKSGKKGITPDSDDAILNPLTASVDLPAPSTGRSQLTSDHVNVVDFTPPRLVSATTGLDYLPNSQAPQFSAVNAYYHCDHAFQMLPPMGFDIPSYFDETTFPVKVESFSTQYDASTQGNATGTGVRGFTFGGTQKYPNMSLATSRRVVLHEFSHALLFDSVHSPNFGFAHSAGDSLAAIVCDPISRAPERGETFPWFLPGDQRRHDRDVADGWSWGGDNDWGNEKDHRYLSEQILSSTLFRAYLSAGGDSTDPKDRQFASDFLAYLIVRGIGSLATSPITPTPTADVFATALMTADIGTPSLTGHVSGTFHKVIRWAFEKQGLYRLPHPGAATNTPGDPPPVDVYIDDGRHGEYPYHENFWSSPDIWNRPQADGKTKHQRPILGQKNFVYVRVTNRGTQPATGVEVSAYGLASSMPAINLMWQPHDWAALTTPPITLTKPIKPGSKAIAGPIEWTPTAAAHEWLLATVSAIGDRSNVDPAAGLPCGAGPTSLGQLVPFDNNIALRDVAQASGHRS